MQHIDTCLRNRYYRLRSKIFQGVIKLFSIKFLSFIKFIKNKLCDEAPMNCKKKMYFF